MSLSCQGIELTVSEHQPPILSNINVTLDAGELVVLIGPSGCGKSTLLNILTGLTTPSAGNVLLNNKIQNGIVPSVGMIFQEYTLYPWLTVYGNIQIGLSKIKSKTEKEQKTQDIINKIGLTDHQTKFPHQLSGGMRQRVAIARSLTQNPNYILMDEPFSALDFQTRYLMQNFLLEIRQTFSPGILFVTHHIEEAILLADRILLMSTTPGCISEELQVNLPRPRDISSPTFNEYRTHLVQHLKREAEKTFISDAIN